MSNNNKDHLPLLSYTKIKCLSKCMASNHIASDNTLQIHAKKLPQIDTDLSQFDTQPCISKQKKHLIIKHFSHSNYQAKETKKQETNGFLGPSNSNINQLKLLLPTCHIDIKNIDQIANFLHILPNQPYIYWIAHQALLQEKNIHLVNPEFKIIESDKLYLKDVVKSQQNAINSYVENNLKGDFKTKIIELSWLLLVNEQGGQYFYNIVTKESSVSIPDIPKCEVNYILALQNRYKDIKVMKADKSRNKWNSKETTKEDACIQSDMNTIIDAINDESYKSKKAILDKLFYRKKLIRINKKRHVYNLLNLYVKSSQSSKKLPMHSFLNLSPRSAMGIFKPIVYEEGIQTVNNCSGIKNSNCRLIKYKSHTKSTFMYR